MLLATAVPVHAAATMALPFSAAGYGDRTARGFGGEIDYFFALPAGDTSAPGSAIDLDLSHSPLLLPDRSTVTVSVNGTALTSARLDAGNAAHGHLQVELPPPGAATGFFVQVQFGMRLTKDDCEDPNNPALWATVFGDSQLSLLTTPDPARRTVASLPSLLGPPLDGAPVLIGLPPQPASSEIDTAAAVAYAVGRQAAAEHSDPLVGLAGSTPANVAIRSGGRLEVTAGEPLQIQAGSAAEVRAAVAVERPGPAPWSQSAASFAQLGYTEQSVAGPGGHELDLSFDRPPGWDVSAGAGLDLSIDVEGPIRTDTSTVAIRVDGHPAGTQMLHTGTSHYHFPLPAGEISSELNGQPIRFLNLAVRLYLDEPQQRCQPLPATATSATVLEGSSWYLPHQVASSLDIGRFPAAFSKPVIVIPNSAGHGELEAALQLAAAFGRWSAPAPRIVSAKALGSPGGADLVLVGAADAELGRPAAMASPAANGCEMAVASSPWNSSHQELVIHGGSGTLIACARALSEASVISQVRGREVEVVAARPSSIAPAPGGHAPPELTPVLRPGLWDQFPTRQLAAAVILVIFVAAAVIVAVRRYGNR